MSRFYTGNPLGSGSPLDLDDNAKNFDLAAISPEDTFLDRFKQTRLTYAGMESEFQSAQESRSYRFNNFIASSGYQFVGDYAPGIEITEYSHLVRGPDGEFWRVAGTTELPYITSGSGVPEGGALVSVGDAVLRQDLSNPDKGATMVAYVGPGGAAYSLADLADSDKGAAMVARSVVAVDSIADLLALPSHQRRQGLRYLVKGYHAGSDAGGGEFYWDPERVDEDDSGIILSPIETVEGRFIRRIEDHVSPLYFGGRGDAVSDDSAAFGAALVVAESRGLPIKLGPHKFIVGDLSTSGVDIYGERGSAIIAKPGSLTIIDVTGSSPVHWSGFVLDGTGTSARAVKFDQVSYVTWRDISITGFSVRCVLFEGLVSGALIIGGEVSNCTGPDVFCYKGSNGKFTGVHFNDCSEHVIRFGRFNSDPDILSRHNTVTGCSFRNIGNDPVLYEVGARGGVVSNNTFVNCRRIVKVETTADAQTRDFVVSGNIFTGQIGVAGEAIKLLGVVRSVVEGNHIDGAAMGITVGAQGIVNGNYVRNASGYAILYSDACTVSANVLDGIGGDGIRARSASDGAVSTITGNVLTSAVLGVGVNSTASDCVIANNTIRSQGAAVRLVSSSTHTIVNGNNLRGAGPSQDTSGNSVFSNNIT